MELFKNFAKSRLQNNVTSGAQTLFLTSGDGALFPSPSNPDYFNLVLDNGTNYEVVKVTTRSVDTLTVLRAQQSTVGHAFLANDRAEHRLTADPLTKLISGVGIWAKVSNTTDTTLLTATNVIPTFNTDEYDPDNFHSLVSNQSRFTIPTGLTGYYDIHFVVNITNDAAVGITIGGIIKNGATTLAQTYVLNINAGFVEILTIAPKVLLTAGDYVEAIMIQTSGNTQSARGTATYAYSSVFTIERKVT